MALPGIPIPETQCIGDSLWSINNGLTALDVAVATAAAAAAGAAAAAAGGVTKITAGTNITISPAGGTGNVTINGADTGANVTVQDTPPSSPSAGDLWYDSSSGVLSIYYDSQWVDTGGGDAGMSEADHLLTLINELSTNMNTIRNYPYLEYAWVTAPNAAGQPITADTITTLTLNTEVADTGNFGSISSNQITLAAGTYQFQANTHMSLNGGGEGTLSLFNVSDSSYISRGSSQSGRSDNCDAPTLIGQFSITSSKVFEIRYYNDEGGNISNRAGSSVTTISTAGAEQRTTIKLWKVG
jgi:hypothetical protein